MQSDRLAPAHPVAAAIPLVAGPLCAAEAWSKARRNLRRGADNSAAACWRRVGMRWLPVLSMGTSWDREGGIIGAPGLARGGWECEG